MDIIRFEFLYFSPSLYDVCIKGEDGVSVQCHKCVLVARLEYFRSMLGSGWVEVSVTNTNHFLCLYKVKSLKPINIGSLLEGIY